MWWWVTHNHHSWRRCTTTTTTATRTTHHHDHHSAAPPSCRTTIMPHHHHAAPPPCHTTTMPTTRKTHRQRKQQVSDLFNSQEALGNISPLTAIEKFSSARNGKIWADLWWLSGYSRSNSIGPYAKEFFVVGRYLSRQNKAEAYYAPGRQQLWYDIHCPKLFPITSTCNSRKFKIYYPVPTRRRESHTNPCWPLC